MKLPAPLLFLSWLKQTVWMKRWISLIHCSLLLNNSPILLNYLAANRCDQIVTCLKWLRSKAFVHKFLFKIMILIVFSNYWLCEAVCQYNSIMQRCHTHYLYIMRASYSRCHGLCTTSPFASSFALCMNEEHLAEMPPNEYICTENRSKIEKCQRFSLKRTHSSCRNKSYMTSMRLINNNFMK